MLIALLVPLLLASCLDTSRSNPPPPERPVRAAGASSAAPDLPLPPGIPSIPPESLSTPFPPTTKPAPLRVIAVEPTGALCVLDADTGALRSRQEVSAVDVIEDRSGPGRLVAVEPSLNEEEPGRLARYELRGDLLERTTTLPFDAPEGRLLDADGALVGLSIREGTTLFRATEGEGPGRSWGSVRSMAARPLGSGEVELLTAGVEDAGRVELRRTSVGPQGIPEGTRHKVDAGEGGVAVFAGSAGFGRAWVAGGRLKIVWEGHALDGAEVEASGAHVQGALWLTGGFVGGDSAAGSEEAEGEGSEGSNAVAENAAAEGEGGGTLAVLTGPEPELHLFREGSYRMIALGPGPLPAPSLPGHLLAHDPSRGRLWVVVHRALRGVSLTEERVVAEGACKATGVALATPL